MARTPCLFEPLSLGGITLANRIAVSPMCQYSAERLASPATDAGARLSSEPTRYDDGPQPVADLDGPANGIHDLARYPIAPNQVTAGRLAGQRSTNDLVLGA